MIPKNAATCVILAISLTISRGEAEADPAALAHIMRDLSSLGNTELSVISDFSTDPVAKAQVLSKLQVPFHVYDLHWLQQRQSHLPAEPCPTFGTGDGEEHLKSGDPNESQKDLATKHYPRDEPILPLRRPLLPAQNHHRSLFFWVETESDVAVAYKVLNDTVMWCPQKIHVGMLDPGSRFYFYSRRRMDRVVFSFERFRLLPSVANVYPLTADKFAINNYDFFLDQPQLVSVWSRSKFESTEEIFTSQKDFKGHHFLVGTVPWTYHVLGEPLLAEEPHNTTVLGYRDYWGYEIEILKAVSKALHFSYAIVNPPDMLWGNIKDDGTWSGMVWEAAKGAVDFIISDIFITYTRHQVMDGTVVFDKDYQTFASPMPRPLPKYLSLVNPFTELVWMALFCSVLIVSATMWTISKTEGKLVGEELRDWSLLKRAGWYCYGTFLGEAITRDTKSHRAQALRWILSVWILYCFILSTSYAGILKAFLTTPTYTKPISTLAEVLESGLPWKMVLYGEEGEVMMAQSQNPIIRTIWEDKIVEDFAPIPKIKDVYEGKSIFVDYKSGLEPSIFSHYSTPRGDPLIHISPNPIFRPSYAGWGFPYFNPWRPTFDKYFRKMMEGGLVDLWKYRTLVRMREEARKEAETLEIEEKSVISALSLDHLQSVFYLCSLMLGCSLVLFLGEKMTKLCKTLYYRRGRAKLQEAQEMSVLP